MKFIDAKALKRFSIEKYYRFRGYMESNLIKMNNHNNKQTNITSV